jgi:hypothetical protein
MLVASFSMAFLALMLNLVAAQYAHGAFRAALDEGVRRGAPAPAGELECRQGIEDVLDDLLGGAVGEGVHTACRVAGGEVVATAQGAFPIWLPGVPDIGIMAEVRAVKELDG